MSTTIPAELAEEIMSFLAKHARSSADYDPAYDRPEERYSSPDAAELHSAATLLQNGCSIPRLPWSDWGSGGYGPYSDEAARAWHDDLLKRLELAMSSAYKAG